jgi:Fe2+ transport system protein B
MPNNPFENIFSKVKSGTKTAAVQMARAGKIAKLKVEIASQKADRERLIKTIGTKIYSIYCKEQRLVEQVMTDEVTSELSQVQRIEAYMKELEQQVSQLQLEMRNADGNIIDATEVKESDQ